MREKRMGWRSGQPYSGDLRERVLAAVDDDQKVRHVATLFRVSVSYIYKAVGRRRSTGETAIRANRGRLGRKLALQEDALVARVRAEPDATLTELQAWLLAEFKVQVSIGCLWNTLDRRELTFKKDPP
jgi:transposase